MDLSADVDLGANWCAIEVEVASLAHSTGGRTNVNATAFHVLAQPFAAQGAGTMVPAFVAALRSCVFKHVRGDVLDTVLVRVQEALVNESKEDFHPAHVLGELLGWVTQYRDATQSALMNWFTKDQTVEWLSSETIAQWVTCVVRTSFLEHSQVQEALMRLVQTCLERSFRSTGGKDDDEDEEGDDEDEKERNNPEEFEAVFEALRHLDWMRACDHILSDLLVHHVKQRTGREFTDVFDEDVLTSIEQWVDGVVLPLLAAILGANSDVSQIPFPPPSSSSSSASSSSSSSSVENVTAFHTWVARVRFLAYETFAALGIDAMFDIVVEFPSSAPALKNLRRCLEFTAQQHTLSHTLQASIKKRLLQPGANTNDIISFYISLIHGMTLFDPTGTLLAEVTLDTRKYLRSRPDTVRCIMQSLIGERSGVHAELKAELEKQMDNDDEGPEASAELHGDASDCEHENGEALAYTRWQPPAVNAAQSLSLAATNDPLRPGNIIGMLVSIYGSKELFVKEYKSILADRLLMKTDFEIDEEIGNLELLKLKFGENSLHDCEVMVRDLMISKRINANIHQNSSSSSQKERKHLEQQQEGQENENPLDAFSAIIVSKEFWPELEQSDTATVLPSPIQRAVAEYSEAYAVLKHPRYLTFSHNLGTVELELDFADRSLSFSVSPLLASLIHCFDDVNQRSIGQLCDELKLDSDAVVNGMRFWVDNAVVRETVDGNTGEAGYATIEVLCKADEEFLAAKKRARGNSNTISGVRSGGTASESQDNAMAFVLGILARGSSLSLRELHERLQALQSADFDYSLQLKELKVLLDQLIREDKLVCVESRYKRKQQSR